MTVRWKPLFILSGLFFVVAVRRRDRDGLDPRAEVRARCPETGPRRGRRRPVRGRRDLLQAGAPVRGQERRDPRGVRRPLPRLGKTAPADRQETLPAERVDHLRQGGEVRQERQGAKIAAARARHGPGQRRRVGLLGQEVLKVDADNADAHYVLAAEELETRSPNVPEVKRHLKALETGNAPAIRRALVRAGSRRSPATIAGATRRCTRRRAASLAGSRPDRPDRPRPTEVLEFSAGSEIQSRERDGDSWRSVKTLLAHVKELTAIPDVDPGQVTG